MKVKTISVTYGRKWNLDNYESATVEATAWADLDDGESEAEATTQLFAMAKAQVKAESACMLEGRERKRRELATEALEGWNGNQGSH